MFTITLNYFLIAYLLFLAIVALFLIVNLYHLTVNASLTLPSFFATVFVFGLMIIVLFETHALLAGVDWQQPIISLNSGTFQTNTIPTL